MKNFNEKGQVILILLLVMTVALGVGLSIIQRSLTDVFTSTKVEQSSRAFSAAEAGIERALQGDTTVFTSGVNFLEAQSKANVSQAVDLPAPNQALEWPEVKKEEIAHFWLADPDSSSNPPAAAFTGTSLNIYWGTPNLTTDRAAIEATIIYYDSASSSYKAIKKFYDPDGLRRSQNSFDVPTNCSDSSPPTLSTSLGPNRTFYCTVSLIGLPSNLMVLRTRLLYTSVAQSIAVDPIGGSLPYQAKVYTAVGSSGDTQRTIQLITEKKVVPFYFDYALFSTGPIEKK